MRIGLVVGFCCVASFFAKAQFNPAFIEPKPIQLQDVVVTGIRAESVDSTALHIERHTLHSLEENAPLNLSDAMSAIPGISQMTTGNSISKPVIRGLFGQRILTLLSGLRFDNQQWQDEHGLGLSQIGIDRVEIIKGPASLLYGTDAMGGVINIIEEEVPHGSRFSADVNTRIFSNTGGTLTDIGLQHRNDDKWWRMRAGVESHADYTDGNGTRVLNSRNTGYYFKAGAGFTKKRWSQNNAYNFSFNQYGFILPDLKQYFDEDARYSRAFGGPHHNVTFHTFSSQNDFQLRASTLKINAGFQSNQRAEDEGGGAISLNMHLLSFLENAQWEKKLSKKKQLIIHQQLSFENNTNYGKRKIIPDANLLEGNLSAFLHVDLGKWIVEGGVGINYKQIKTFKTSGINDGNVYVPDPSLMPFYKTAAAANAMLGVSYNPSPFVNLKANIATGNRMANLAELSSNGLHEGVYRYEVGNPDFKMEQNLNADATLSIIHQKWYFSASGFFNRFFNYIYLAPTNKLFQGLYYEYRFRQQNASLFGGEMTAKYWLFDFLQGTQSFSITEGMLDEAYEAGGSRYLPFIPAWKSVSSLRFKRRIGKQHDFFFKPELEYYFPQRHPAQFETNTADYALVNLHARGSFRIRKHWFNAGISANNLFNKTYASHLSRLKYFGINNTGRNVNLSLSTRF